MFKVVGIGLGVFMSVSMVYVWWQEGGRMYLWSLLIFPALGLWAGDWLDEKIKKPW